MKNFVKIGGYKMLKDHTQETIGTLLTDEAYRDAIHIAVVTVVAGDAAIPPGSPIKFLYGTKTVVGCAMGNDYYTGIADPFLKETILRGQRFWMFIKPNTVNGMRHEWRHPDFEVVTYPRSKSEQWLSVFAMKWNIDYDDMIAEALSPGGSGAVTARNRNLHRGIELGEDENLFWEHLENLTRLTFDKQHRENLTWSCSC